MLTQAPVAHIENIEKKDLVWEKNRQVLAEILGVDPKQISVIFLRKNISSDLAKVYEDMFSNMDDASWQNSPLSDEIKSSLNNFSSLVQYENLIIKMEDDLKANPEKAQDKNFMEKLMLYKNQSNSFNERLSKNINIVIGKLNSGELKYLPSLENSIKSWLPTIEKYYKTFQPVWTQVDFEEVK